KADWVVVVAIRPLGVYLPGAIDGDGAEDLVGVVAYLGDGVECALPGQMRGRGRAAVRGDRDPSLAARADLRIVTAGVPVWRRVSTIVGAPQIWPLNTVPAASTALVTSPNAEASGCPKSLNVTPSGELAKVPGDCQDT